MGFFDFLEDVGDFLKEAGKPAFKSIGEKKLWERWTAAQGQLSLEQWERLKIMYKDSIEFDNKVAELQKKDEEAKNQCDKYGDLINGVMVETYTSSQGIKYNICVAAFHREDGDCFSTISTKGFCHPDFGKVYERYYYKTSDSEIFPSSHDKTWNSVENVKVAIEQREEEKRKKAEQERAEQEQVERERVEREQRRAQWEQETWQREQEERLKKEHRQNDSTVVTTDCDNTKLMQIEEFILDGSNIMRIDEQRGGITLCKVLAITNVLEGQGISYKVIFDASAKHVLREKVNDKECQYLIHLFNTKPEQWFEAPAKTQADDYILMLASESPKVHVISNDMFNKKNETERYVWASAPESQARFHRGMVNNGKIYYPGLCVFTIPETIPDIND